MDKTTLVLRPTLESDLDAVRAIERHPDNASFVGQWSRDQHELALRREGTEHVVLTSEQGESVVGYLIAYDLVADGFGVWVQRIAVTTKGRGVGRAALAAYLADIMLRRAADSAVLDVMRANPRAQRMYRSIGFAEVTLPHDALTRLEHLVGGIDDDVMVMRLDRPALQTHDRYEVRIA